MDPLYLPEVIAISGAKLLTRQPLCLSTFSREATMLTVGSLDFAYPFRRFEISHVIEFN